MGHSLPDPKIFSLGGVTLRVACGNADLASQVEALWQQLFVLDQEEAPEPERRVNLCFRASGYLPGEAAAGQEVYRSPGLRVLRTQAGFCLRCGDSFLNLDLARSYGEGVLDAAFWHAAPHDQREFFLLSFLMLLRRHGLYGLHANGVVSGDARDETGCLIVAPSGHGKTTLTLGLVQAGWRYLSDDALMLRSTPAAVQALALRRGFSCTVQTATRLPELRAVTLGAIQHADGKRRVDVDRLYPGRFSPRCAPNLLLFPEIGGGLHSRLLPVDPTWAITALIQQSPGILVDRPAVVEQVEVLKRLVGQARSYRILLGEDVYDQSARVSDLLRSAGRGRPWLES